MNDQVYQQSVSWRQWLLWAVLNPFLLLGSMVATAFILAFLFWDNDSDSIIFFYNLLLLFILGLISSAAQYLLLRRIAEYPTYWVCTGGCVTLIAGNLSFLTLTFISSWPLVGVCIGSMIGLAQWANLRHTLKYAIWWVGIQTYTWGCSLVWCNCSIPTYESSILQATLDQAIQQPNNRFQSDSLTAPILTPRSSYKAFPFYQFCSL